MSSFNFYHVQEMKIYLPLIALQYQRLICHLLDGDLYTINKLVDIDSPNKD